MTDIIFRFSNPSPTGVDVPATGFVECSLVTVEHSVAGTRTLERFAVDLVDGLAALALSPTTAGQAWHIVANGLAGVHEFYKAVPDSTTPLRYDLLGDVDPATLTTSTTGQAAWTATLGEVTALVVEARALAAGGTGGASVAIDPVHPGVGILTIGSTPAAPGGLTNPVSSTVIAGAAVTFSATAATGTPTPTVQWQSNAGAGWVDIAGATSTTLVFVTVIGDSGKQYRAVFTNAASPAGVPTSAATLTVSAAGTAPAFTAFALGADWYDSDAFLQVRAVASGSPSPTIQIQTLPLGASTGAWTTQAFVPVVGLAGYYRWDYGSAIAPVVGSTIKIRAVATNGIGTPATSAEIAVTQGYGS
ncbi:hypothetical protein QN354_02200 [Cryobacterium sp. 5I3]|uniref:hypothetical protein n=1 Tax=Cryobacterium sp. 5I3 TaxID=3048592 RepID=UPI002B22C088|nr:hypothetical protein [Cryobacterium sp. 5I3]MEB0200566.1 hypothetical protein [Cryobacterium sp. 5I3]